MSPALMTQTQQSTAAPESALWGLDDGQVLRLDIGPGWRELHVTQGRLWLTRAGTAERPAVDLWLQSGDTVALESGSEWVAEGWGVTRFQLLVPPQACASLVRRLRASLSAQRRSFWPEPLPG